MKVIVLIVLAVVIIACVPFGLIWSLNNLFGLGIQYGPAQWLAGLFLMAWFTPFSKRHG